MFKKVNWAKVLAALAGLIGALLTGAYNDEAIANVVNSLIP